METSGVFTHNSGTVTFDSVSERTLGGSSVIELPPCQDLESARGSLYFSAGQVNRHDEDLVYCSQSALPRARAAP